jgi:hypothetical protein
MAPASTIHCSSVPDIFFRMLNVNFDVYCASEKEFSCLCCQLCLCLLLSEEYLRWGDPLIVLRSSPYIEYSVLFAMYSTSILLIPVFAALLAKAVPSPTLVERAPPTQVPSYKNWLPAQGGCWR